MESKILLIAPHLEMAALLQHALQTRGFSVGLNMLQYHPERKPQTAQYDVVISLARAEPLAEDSNLLSPAIDAVFLSAAHSGANAIQSFQNGVYRMHANEASDLEKFVHTIEALLAEKTRSSLDENLETGDTGFISLQGTSPQIEKVRQTILRASRFPGMPVLISGESGTGKELVAHLLHARSVRARRPLIKVNCSALPETLIESQFFGHRKGAFTGAISAQKGLVEAAEDGMLFLDEIGTLKLELQPKLLRLLENGAYLPVGETAERKSQAWIVTATNQDVQEAVQKNLLRADLYYRLRGVEIVLPPLRKRGEDAAQLAEHFLAEFAREYGLRFSGLPEDLRACILRYDWPGNVRELKHAMRSLFITAPNVREMASHFRAKYLPDSIAQGESEKVVTTLRDFEKIHITETLQRTCSNLKKSARLLGITRNTLLRKMVQFGIARDAFRTPK